MNQTLLIKRLESGPRHAIREEPGNPSRPRLARLSLSGSNIGCPKDVLQVTPAEDQHVVKALPSERPLPALGERFAFGARTGVFTTVRPSVRKTSSKGQLGISIPDEQVNVIEVRILPGPPAVGGGS